MIVIYTKIKKIVVIQSFTGIRLEYELYFACQHGGPEGVLVNSVTEILELTIIVGSLNCSQFLSSYLE